MKNISYQEITRFGIEVFDGTDKFNQWMSTYNKFLETQPQDLIYHPSNVQMLYRMLKLIQLGSSPPELLST